MNLVKLKFLLENKIWFCPKSGHLLVVRRNSVTKKSFLGCPGFPLCRFTLDFNEWDMDPHELYADHYISPLERVSMDGAGSIGPAVIKKPINRVDGRYTE